MPRKLVDYTEPGKELPNHLANVREPVSVPRQVRFRDGRVYPRNVTMISGIPLSYDPILTKTDDKYNRLVREANKHPIIDVKEMMA